LVKLLKWNLKDYALYSVLCGYFMRLFLLYSRLVVSFSELYTNWRMHMPVSGVVVTCLQGQAEDVAGQISAMDGVEIHGLLPDDQIVAVVEAETVNDEVAIVSRLHEVDGVLTVRMAYHNFEDEA
jgi:periplasmic nitrate reductase NapD